MESTKLTQRLGGYIEAIQAARAEGVTWRQLAVLFGAEPKYFHAAVRKVVKAGKHVGREQKPLPDTERAARPVPVGVQAKENTVTAPRRPLPRVGSSNEGEGSNEAARAILANVPKI